MNKTEESYMFFYMEQTCEEMRHLENLRERVSILVITLASAIAGFIVQQKFSYETKFLIWFMLFLGIFGFLMNQKIFQLHQMGQKRLNKWYTYLESNCGEDPQILKLKAVADSENKIEFKYISKVPHNYFWATINFFIIIVGISLFFIKPSKDPDLRPLPNPISIVLSSGLALDTIKLNVDSLNLKNKK